MAKNSLSKLSLVIILGIAYLLLGSYFNIYLPCPIYQITHLYCPGCGITRAFRSLLSLNFYQAFRYYNLIILLPIFIIYYGEDLLDKKGIKNLNLKRFMTNKFWYTILVLVIIYGVLRNIPYFNYLIPTKV